MSAPRLLLVLLALLALTGCGGAASREQPTTGSATMTADPGPSPSATSAGPVAELQVTEILTGLRAPREVVPLDEGRMLVSDQAGRVVVVSDGQVRTEPFLDLSDQVLEPTS